MVFASLFDDMKKKSPATKGEKREQQESRKKIGKRKRPKKAQAKQAKPTAAEAKSTAAGETKHPPKRPRFEERRQRKPPSREALTLSARLKELSSQKRLDEALQLYNDKANDNIRDSHHACSVIDCASRCGDIFQGENVLKGMKSFAMPITTETYTALLKGYSHAGMMHKGAKLYSELCEQTNPNVRSLNTLLRGCLWTAATLESGRVAGGIVTSQVAWKQAGKYIVDTSSFEYYVTQLCQALRLEEAEKEIHRLKQIMKIQTTRGKKADTFEAEDSSALESLAVCMLSLTRAQALLGRDEMRRTAKSTLKAVEAAKAGESTGTSSGTQGGKRAWKKDVDEQRAVSNTLFRGHRLTELRNDTAAVVESRKSGNPKLDDAARTLCNLLMTRLFYFSGGGTTGTVDLGQPEQKSKGATELIFQQLMTTRWLSFGLKEAFSVLKEFEEEYEVLSSRECNLIVDELSLDNLCTFDKSGFLNFSGLFGHGDSKSGERPLDIEMGSGFGDWAYYQAKNKPHRDFVAVELRADRVAQTFARIVLNSKSMSNLACVGAECGSFLKSRVRKDSVSTIFVNHPEPPTQTFGGDEAALARISEGGKEPGHMLSSSIIIAAAECLKPGDGQLVIVTDNRMYARLICVSIVKASKSRPGLLAPIVLEGMVFVESFGLVSLYEGQPGETIRHAPNSDKSGQSYFDRLWQTGAGSHAERSKRFVISVKRADE